MFSTPNPADALEDTMLRSTLLFRSIKPEGGKDDIMLIALLALVTDLRTPSLSQIQGQLRSRFKVDYSDDELIHKLRKLIDKKLIEYDAESKQYLATGAESDRAKRYFDGLEQRIDKLVESILSNMRRACVGESFVPQINERIRSNVKAALSAYFHQYGYSFVGMKPKANELEIKDAVTEARRDLSPRLQDSIVAELFSLINSPTPEQRQTLEEFARAFVTLEILNLDPALRNFKLTRLRDKKFVVDTDVALHCLTTHARHSTEYRQVIDMLVRQVGATLVIPHTTISEVRTHLQSASGHYYKMRGIIDQATDELLEDSNVFVEDYAKILRSDPDKSDMTFDAYLSNFGPRLPQLLEQRMKSVFGQNVQLWPENMLVESTQDGQKLVERIKFYTENSAKGINRPDEYNEEVALNDARLFLTIKKFNDQVDKEQHPQPFSHKYYLLTQSKKIARSVIEIIGRSDAVACICSPAAVMAILREAGQGGKPTAGYIDLFANPFLAYTAHLIWDKVQPVLDQNKAMKYQDLVTLRHNTDVAIHDMLTGDTHSDGMKKRINEMAGREFVFARENEALSTQVMQVEHEAASYKAEMERLKRENEQLRKARALDDYRERVKLSKLVQRPRKNRR